MMPGDLPEITENDVVFVVIVFSLSKNKLMAAIL